MKHFPLLATIALLTAQSLPAQEYFPSANLSFSGSAILVETDQRLAFNATPNGGTPATLGQTNLALASNGAVAFESSRISTSYGDDKLNNGVYGVTFPDLDGATQPWISLDADAGGWGGVKFATPATLGHIGFGSRFDGRSDGDFTMQYTTSDFTGVDLEVPAQVDALSWVDIGTITSTTPTEFGRHLFALTTPVANVTGVRILAAEGGSTVTEIEAYSFVGSHVVTSLADSGAGSLRDIIAAATAGDTLTFDPSLSGKTITLGGTQLLVNKNLTIDASALAKGITINAAGNSRVFEISAGSTVTMNSLTITGGNVTGPTGPANSGGGILSSGVNILNLNRCTLSRNSAVQGGGLYTDTNLTGSVTTLVNCTLSDNQATQRGGGIYNNDGKTVLTHCTISGNTAPAGGGSGVASFGDTFTETEVNGCIIARNSNSDVDRGGGTITSFTSTGSNLIGTGDATGAFTQTGDTAGTNDPKLSPLGHYGGPVQTMHPLAGSAAIDPAGAAATSPLSTDARGFTRVVNSLVDIGAVETGPIIPVDDIGDGVGTATTLRKAIADATTPGAVIRFTSDPFNGESVDNILNGPEFTIGSAQTVFIDASNITGGVTIDSGGTNRIFNINTGATLALHSLTLTGGNASGSFPANSGGAIFSDRATLSLTACTLSGNSADFGGGIFSDGISSGSATLSLTACTLSGNSAGSGGGIYSNGRSSGSATLSLTACTLYGNSAGSFGGGIYSIGSSSGSAPLSLNNTILAGNTAPTGPDLRESGTGAVTTLSGINIIGNNTSLISVFPTGSPNANGDYVGTAASPFDPKLSPLGHYGGPVQAMHPLAGSAAIDPATAATTSPLSTDARGFTRVVNSLVDIGAVETGPIIPVDDIGDGVGTATTLRKAIADATTPGTVIRFNSDPFNGQPADTILNDLEFTIGSAQTVFIDASNITGGVTIDSGGTNRIFNVASGANLALHSLTLTGGNALSDNGGAIFSHGSLTVTDTTLTSNIAAFNGGGIFCGGYLTLNNATLSSNAANDGGGGGILTGSNAVLNNTTFFGNSASDIGGGIYSGGTTSLNHCTFSGNTTLNDGGGIWIQHGSLTMANSISARNNAPIRPDIGNNGGTLTRRGANIIGNNQATTTEFPTGAPNANGDYVGTAASPFDPMLLPLNNYWTDTQTMPPLPGSPAIEGGVLLAGSPLTDQHGNPRPSGALPDIGAVEALPISQLMILTSADGDDIPDILEGPGNAYPHLSPSVDDSAVDTDNDGSPDGEEIANMTDPLDPTSLLKILSMTPAAGFHPTTNPVFEITINTFPGLSYRLESSNTLTGFIDMPSSTFTATGFSQQLNVTLGANSDFVRAQRD